MLDIIRNLVKSIAGKILLLIMVASFAVWGMGDLLTSGDSGLVAKIGNQKITINQFYDQFRKKLSQLNQSLEKPLTEEEAHKQQISYLVLNEMVYGKLVQEFALSNSLYLSDNIIKKSIVSIPQFQDENGKFNKILFDSAMINNFNSEAEFTEEISKVFLNNLLFENFSVPSSLNKKISNTFYNYEYETRDILYFNLSRSFVNEPKIREDELLDFYKENISDFYTDRDVLINYININPESFISSISISNDEVTNYYNQNISDYSEEETRDIDILNANTLDEAKKILSLIDNEEELNIFLKSRNLKFSNLSKIKFNDFDEKLSKEIFDNSIGLIKETIAIDGLGYFIIRINNIISPKVITLEEASIEITDYLKEEAAYQIFLENVNSIEEMNLTGSSINEIAEMFNLQIQINNIEELKFEINEDSYSQLIANEDIGYQSDLIIDDNDNTFIFEVTSIKESYLLSFDEVRRKIIDKIIQNKTNKLLEAKITELELIYKYTNRDTFTNFANQNELKIIEKKGLLRSEKNLFLPDTLKKIFKGKIQSSLMYRAIDGNYGLVFIENVTPADNLINDTEKNKLNANVNASYNQSMENILKNKLGNDIKYELFINNINNLFL